MNLLTPRSLASALAALTLGSICSSAPQAASHDDNDRARGILSTRLSGFNEVHFSAGPPATLRGAVSTKATGRFRAAINERADMIEYELNYADLEGTVTQAHIHFGQAHTVGGIVVWLCQTAVNPAPASVAAVTPVCPQNTAGGPVTGTITPAQVLAQTLQGIDAGEFDELVRAIRAGATYVNVHSSLHPPGEIRGQLRDRRHH
ncbi:MAG: CHRD domain-containing protein [Pseudomonadota bacterium]